MNQLSELGSELDGKQILEIGVASQEQWAK